MASTDDRKKLESQSRQVQRASQTSTHWGAYFTEVRDGRLVGVRAIPEDPNPSIIGGNLPGGVDATCRIRRPAIRRSYLREGPGSHTDRRGAEPFVEVPWDEALDL